MFVQELDKLFFKRSLAVMLLLAVDVGNGLVNL